MQILPKYPIMLISPALWINQIHKFGSYRDILFSDAHLSFMESSASTGTPAPLEKRYVRTEARVPWSQGVWGAPPPSSARAPWASPTPCVRRPWAMLVTLFPAVTGARVSSLLSTLSSARVPSDGPGTIAQRHVTLSRVQSVFMILSCYRLTTAPPIPAGMVLSVSHSPRATGANASLASRAPAATSTSTSATSWPTPASTAGVRTHTADTSKFRHPELWVRVRYCYDLMFYWCNYSLSM